MRLSFLVGLALCLLPGVAGAVGIDLKGSWPRPNGGVEGVSVRFPSSSPFSLADVGRGPELDPPTTAVGTLFMPTNAAPAQPVPAVVFLHGASGVSSARELAYARRFAELGLAALVVDAFAARRDRATGFMERLLEITESMVLADAYGALRYLASMPQVDAKRVAVIGFSYGGMAATYAAYAQVAQGFAPEGLRFAAHIAFYAPCVARFADSRATGAPVLMLMGGQDEIIDRSRCTEIAGDLRAGGAAVETVLYEEAYHQWDAGPLTPWRASANIAPCRFTVEASGLTRDSFTGLAMTGPLSRRAILVLCVDRAGYLIGGNQAIREQSDRVLGAFLSRAFAG